MRSAKGRHIRGRMGFGVCPNITAINRRYGRHNEYVRPDGSVFCKSCGAELAPPQPPKSEGVTP